MHQFSHIISKILPLTKILFVLVWLSNLASTDAYFSVYVLIAFFSFYLRISPNRNPLTDGKGKDGSLILSALFSFLVILANYPIFTTIGDPALIGRSTSIIINFIDSFLSFIGGIIVFHPIISLVFKNYPCKTERGEPYKWFLPVTVFISIIFLNIIHFVFVEYPGNATEDTFTQISEMISGEYSNFNTFWHTMILRSVLMIGYGFFSDINASLALFCVLQMILLAAAFTYCLMTMHELGIPKWFLICAYVAYLLIPYNMALSITVWKDVLFAAATLLMLCSWIRILKGIGIHQALHYIIFAVSSLLFLLSRTNGWIIYLVTFLLVVIPMKHYRKFISLFGIMAVIGWFLLNPALSMLGIPGSDIVESLSIPIQQVSRVIADGCELSQEDQVLLSQIADLDDVPVLYTSWLSDPMKEEIRDHNVSYFEDHIDDYRSLWIRLGLKHPWTYIKAWVDQTKGYWNAGYDYFLYAETITDNPYGVEKTGGNNPIASLFRLYFGLSRHVIFFEPLHSIGLHIWIVLLCFILNVRKKRDEFVISVPLLLLVVGLWFGTPVYSCFRYVYPLFVSFPLILSTALYNAE